MEQSAEALESERVVFKLWMIIYFFCDLGKLPGVKLARTKGGGVSRGPVPPQWSSIPSGALFAASCPWLLPG